MVAKNIYFFIFLFFCRRSVKQEVTSEGGAEVKCFQKLLLSGKICYNFKVRPMMKCAMKSGKTVINLAESETDVDKV